MARSGSITQHQFIRQNYLWGESRGVVLAAPATKWDPTQVMMLLFSLYLLAAAFIIGKFAFDHLLQFQNKTIGFNSLDSDWTPKAASDNLNHITFLSNMISRHRVSPSQSHLLASSIVAEAQLAKIDPLLVAAVIHAESTFKPMAISNRGARGLMQVMPATGKYIFNKKSSQKFSNSRLFEPRFNIRLGISYLKLLKGSFNNNMELALIAYNWGPTNLSKALKQRARIPKSSKTYARKIIQTHRSLRENYTAAVS